MAKNKFSKISSIIRDAKKGKMFILVDDKNRENEGDLIIPGSKCNSKSINFMAKHGRGLICLALTKKQVDNLKLPLMSSVNRSRMQTAFTISIEAKKGITTGISAQDRAKTIKTAINPKVKKNEIVSPGHVFPIIAKDSFLRFLKPSWHRRKQLIKDFKQGLITEEELPKDVLTVLLKNQASLKLDNSDIEREVCFYLQAGSHSTANSLVHAANEILNWTKDTALLAGNQP